MFHVPEEDGSGEAEVVGFRLGNPEALKSLDLHLAHLLAEWQPEVSEYSSLFQDVLGHTSLAVHDVDVGTSTPIKQHPYR